MKNKYQVLPDLSNEEYERLKDDIEANGVALPIDVDEQGNILDGHHRKRICDELGIPCEKTVHPGMSEEEKFDFAIRVNVNRRHMTQEQMTDVIIKFHKAHPDLGNRAVADAVGVSHHTVKGAISKAESDSADKECPGGQSAHLDTVKGSDGKRYPSDAEKAEQQREAVRNAIANDPGKSDRQVARETGASPSTVGAQRKKMRSFHNPSARDEKALQDPDIVRRLEENDKLNIAGAIREQKRDLLVEHLESIEVKEAKAAEGVYDVIVVDPPWPTRKIERDERPNQCEFDYPTMSIDEIKAISIPAAKDCHLFLWTTQRFLPDAFDVLKAWGAKYVCTFVWNKGHDGFQPFKMPCFNCEFCLYAHIGAPEFVDQKAFYCCFPAPVNGHSTKPIEFYSTICRVTAGRRLDMFARGKINGFDSYGKEAPEES